MVNTHPIDRVPLDTTGVHPGVRIVQDANHPTTFHVVLLDADRRIGSCFRAPGGPHGTGFRVIGLRRRLWYGMVYIERQPFFRTKALAVQFILQRWAGCQVQRRRLLNFREETLR